MDFVTYVLVVGFALGTQQKFTPEQLGLTASSLLVPLCMSGHQPNQKSHVIIVGGDGDPAGRP